MEDQAEPREHLHPWPREVDAPKRHVGLDVHRPSPRRRFVARRGRATNSPVEKLGSTVHPLRATRSVERPPAVTKRLRPVWTGPPSSRRGGPTEKSSMAGAISAGAVPLQFGAQPGQVDGRRPGGWSGRPRHHCGSLFSPAGSPDPASGPSPQPKAPRPPTARPGWRARSLRPSARARSKPASVCARWLSAHIPPSGMALV